MRLRHRSFALASLILFLGMTPHLARATQMILQTVEQMTYRSDAVVRAVPTGEKPVTRWTNPDGTGLIVTTTTLRVVEGISGGLAPGQILSIEHLGGSVGALSMLVPGMLVFRPGEEVIIFAKRGDLGRYHVLDLAMGKFEVGTSDGTLTRRDLQDVQMVGETPETPRTLTSLRTSVARAATRKAALLKAGRPLPDVGSEVEEEVR